MPSTYVWDALARNNNNNDNDNQFQLLTSRVVDDSSSESSSTKDNGDEIDFDGEDEFWLLRQAPSQSAGTTRAHDLSTAPLLTRDAFLLATYDCSLPQVGVLGSITKIISRSNVFTPGDPRVYINTNTPFSAIICGVQGSGKSHTTSVIVENFLVPDLRAIGSLKKPLAGLVLHYSESGCNTKPCEAAWVGIPTFASTQVPKVHVYVSPSSLQKMQGVYAPLGDTVTVLPLYFIPADLDAQAILSMMAVDSSSSAPLYIQTVLKILRNLGDKFSYKKFQTALEEEKREFNPAQKAGLNQRLSLLESFITHKKLSSSRFAAGQLTILDLSDPFIDPASACSLFEIFLRLFVRAEINSSKFLVVDEAHKYLSADEGKNGLTQSLVSFIRQQRHLAMRVIISTQEPTVVPSILLGLCTVAILHRFSSPMWWEHLAKHLAADASSAEIIDRIMQLRTGEAIIVAPSGLGMFPECLPSAKNEMGDQSPSANMKLGQFGRRYLTIKTRRRVTRDGGASVLAV